MTDNPRSDTLTAQSPSANLAPDPGGSSASGGSAPAGTVDVARDQAASVGEHGASAAQHVAGVAQEQVENVAAETGNQARELLGQARAELSEQASAQQQRVATGLHALGDELGSMSQNVEQAGLASDLARQGAGRAHDIASWLEDREPGDLIQELQTFARHRPGTFLLVAAGAGLLAGRLTRGVKDAGGDDGPSGGDRR